MEHALLEVKIPYSLRLLASLNLDAFIHGNLGKSPNLCRATPLTKALSANNWVYIPAV